MKLVIGIGGASGSLYAKVLLDTLRQQAEVMVGVVMSDNAMTNWALENPDTNLESLPYKIYQNKDFTAPFASGSAQWDAMIICPCSAGLMGRIAHGISDDLITRAADVMLKERKKLVLVFRETPLSLIHIENMQRVTQAGGIICPAIPSFYSAPSSLEKLARTVTDRSLQLAGISVDAFRWGQTE